MTSNSPPSHFKREQDEKLIKLALHRNPFFTCLDEEQIERFVAAAELKVFAPGEIVILEGCIDRYEEKEDGQREVLQVNKKSAAAEEEDEIFDYYDDDGEYQRMLNDGGGPADADELLIREEPPLSKQDDDDEDVPLPEEVQEEETRTIQSQGLEEGEIDVIADDIQAKQEEEETDEEEETRILSPPLPPQSLVKRSIYIVKSGQADVWYRHFNPASLAPGTVFGEGGFLFGRQHSASVIASRMEPLECWVVDFATFCKHVLPSKNMSNLFHRHATKQDGSSNDGVFYMTMQDFVKAIESQEASSTSTTSAAVLDPLVSLRIANTYNILSTNNINNNNSNNFHYTDKDDRIYLEDFCFFYMLMARPDPEVDIAFLLMDQRRTGQIQLDDLRNFIAPIDPSLDLTSEFFRRYFGPTGTLCIRQQDFSQFLVDLQREMGKQTFLRAVQERGLDNGYLSPKDFVHVIQRSCGWRLPQGVADRLESMYCRSPTQAGEAAAVVSVRAGALKGSSVKEVVQSTEASVLADMEQREKNLGMRYFAYGDFLAFQEVLAMLPGICNLIDRAQQIKQGPVSADDFKVANRVLGLGGRLSRRQVDIIFTLFDLDRDGFVSHEDTVSVCGVDFAQRLVAVRGRNGLLTFAPPPEFRHGAAGTASTTTSAFEESVPVASRIGLLGLTAFAGALGVVALSPLELIKTRLMNQRITKEQGGRLYKHSLDCLRQVLRTEGVLGLYRGLTPQLLGVAPEKAIKLQVNNLLRQVFATTTTTGDGSNVHKQQRTINLPLEVVAGAGAGASQLLVTNPMEIVKTRLILQGETAQMMIQKGLTPPPSQTFRGVVRGLGVPGVYRGALACLLRDIPFSAIYFPAYAICKNALAERHDEASGMFHKASLSDLLLAGTLAGVPAALLTTPCDVIRVRLQAIPRPGESAYSGIRDCATKIYENEGMPGFFRGSAARVLRIAPQFGISLLAYEQITQGFGFTQAASPPTNAPVDPRDYRTAFPAAALRHKTDDIDSWMRHFGVQQPPAAANNPFNSNKSTSSSNSIGDSRSNR